MVLKNKDACLCILVLIIMSRSIYFTLIFHAPKISFIKGLLDYYDTLIEAFYEN